MPTQKQIDELSHQLESAFDASSLLHAFYDDLENLEEEQMHSDSSRVRMYSEIDLNEMTRMQDTIDLSEDDYEIIE